VSTPKKQQRIIPAIPGIVLIFGLAGSLTYGAYIGIAEATKPEPQKTVVVVKEEPKEEPVVEAPAPAPAPEPAPAPNVKTATTNSFVYLRPTASTSGEPLQDLQSGTTVQYDSVTPGLWQKVTVNGQTGYVFKKWLTY
jgi:uncharacterized protein YgiM (DUF1202 family)